MENSQNLELVAGKTKITGQVVVDGIISVFSLEIPENSEFSAVDFQNIKWHLAQIGEKEQVNLLASHCEFIKYLDLDISEQQIELSFRKLVAYGYFIRSYEKEKVIEILDNSIKFIEFYSKNPDQNSKIFSFTVGYFLANLCQQLKEIAKDDLNFKQFFKIIEISIFIFLNPKFLVEDLINLYFEFFIDAFILFSTVEIDTQEKIALLSNLIKVVTSILAMPIALKFDSIGFAYHILALLAQSNKFRKLFDYSIRTELFLLITSICTKYQDAAQFLIEPDNTTLFIDFIADSIQNLTFDKADPKIIDTIDELDKCQDITNHIDSTFKENIISQDYQIITDFKVTYPDPPSKITTHKEALSLLQAISRFVLSIRFQEHEKTNIFLISSVLGCQKLSEFLVTPYFLSEWLSFFVKPRILSCIRPLHESQFFMTMSDLIFIKYPQEDLIKYFTEMMLTIATKSENQYYYILYLIQFFENSIKKLYINERFIDLFIKCILIRPNLFIIAANELLFPKTIGKLMISLQNYHHEKFTKKSESQKCQEEVEKCHNTRIKLFQIIDVIVSIPEGTSLLWNDSTFALSICKLLYDDSTSDFANKHLKKGFSENLSQSSYKSIFDFFEHIMLVDAVTEEKIINLLDSLTISLKSERKSNIEIVISETNLLTAILEFFVKKKSQNVQNLFDVLILLPQKIVKPSFYIKSLDIINEPVDRFLKLIFKDDKKLTTPRLIYNAMPYPALFVVMSKSDEDLEKLIDFTIECINNNNQSLYNLYQSDLSTTIINFLKQYRTERKFDNLFTKALNLFEKIAKNSLNSSELIQYLQLLPSISKDHRPFYTQDVLKTFKNILNTEENLPTTFIHVENENHFIKVKQNIPKYVFNNSFFIFMKAKITSAINGYLFSFFNDCGDMISLMYNQGRLCFLENEMKSATPSSIKSYFNETQNESKFSSNWTPLICFVERYNIESRVTIFTDKVTLQTRVRTIVHQNDFTEMVFCNDLEMDVSSIIVVKGELTSEKNHLLMNMPAMIPCGFSLAEKANFDDRFSPLFEEKFVSNIICNFNASVTNTSNELISLASEKITARMSGTINKTQPGTISVLTTLGGASVLLPIFSQIHQEHFENQDNDETFLFDALSVLDYVLLSSYNLQEEFYLDSGFKILSFLLSMIHPSYFNTQVIDELFVIFEHITHKKLSSSMFKYIFMNMNLWIYVSNEFQKKIFEKSFGYLCQREYLQKCFPLRKILSYIHIFMWESISEISLLSEPKEMMIKNSVSKRPEMMKPLRDIFIQGAFNISKKYLDEEDVKCLFNYSFDSKDITLQEEILELLVSIFSAKNEIIIEYIRNDKEVLNDMFALLKLGNTTIFANIAIFYSKVSEFKVFEDFPVQHWIRCMINEFPVLLNPYHAFEILLRAIDREMSKVCCPDVFPLLVYVALANYESSLHCITDIIKVLSDRQNWLLQNFFYIQPAFVSLLISELPNDYDQSEIADKVIEFLVSIFAFNVSYLEDVYRTIILFSANSCECYNHILRKIFAGVLASKKLKLPWGSEEDTETTIKFFATVFNYIFYIPQYDPYYEIQGSGFNYHVNEKTPYQYVFDVLANNSHQKVNLRFATRTNFDLTWEDLDIAQYLLLDMLSFTPCISFESGWITCAEMIGYLFASIVENNRTAMKFINGTFERISMSIPRMFEKNTHFYNLFVLTAGSLLREYIAGTNTADIKKIHLILMSFRKPFEKQFSVNLSQNTTIEAFKSSLVPTNPIISKLIQELIKVEDSFVKRTPYIFDDFNRGMDIFQNIVLKFDGISKFYLSSLKDIPLSKVTENSDILDNRAASEKYRQSFEFSKAKGMKRYRQLFATLSDINQPWFSSTRMVEHHYKLRNATYFMSKHSRMKRNLDFDDHMDASDARDTGALEESKERYKEIMRDRKMTEFTGDAALSKVALEVNELELKDEKFEEENINDSASFIVDATIITQKESVKGKLLLFKHTLRFQSDNKNVSIKMDSIRKILFRRILHLDTALEIFTNKFKSYFFDFKEGNRAIFLKNIKKYASGKNKSMTNLKFIQEKQEDVIKLAEKVYRKWQLGEISNFELIMKLNKYSGRSFNELSQYPVFPWIIKDYTSQTLNLDKSETFRDLSMPLGAMNEERSQMIQEQIDSGSGYHYGSFYSSAATTIGYLIRTEPFTTLHIDLQSGKFDNPNRLFNSVPAAWTSVTSPTMDFRELIPEFFYFPDMFINNDNFNLGVNKHGEKVNHVELPPWADDETFNVSDANERQKQKAQKFVSLNMKALESQYVSSNLHKWINLIFGPKSRGEKAMEAKNKFHPYFFPESLTEETEQDPQLEGLIKEYAACFGAAPTQLFFEDPQPKMALFNPLQEKMFSVMDVKNISDKPVILIKATKSTIAFASNDGTICVYNVFDQTKSITVKFNVKTVITQAAFAGNLFCASVKGDTAVMCYDFTKSADAFFISRAHIGKITSLSSSGEILATGSEDMTVRLWRRTDDNVSMRNESTLSMHTSEICCLDTNIRSDLVVSVGIDGFIVATSLVDMSYSSYVRTSKIDIIAKPTMVSISDSGYVCIFTNHAGKCKADVFDENLTYFYSSWIAMTATSVCHAQLPNGETVYFVGSSTGKIFVIGCPFANYICSFDVCSVPLTSIAFDRILMHVIVGTSDGNLHTIRISNFRNIP